jgi:hypothetical protein
MAVRDIMQGDIPLARYIPADTAWQEGLNFYSSDSDYIQVGVWGYQAGKSLKAHIHNNVPREVLWTQEAIFVRRGRLLAKIFDTAGDPLTDVELKTGDIILMLRGGHGYEVLEDGTEVLEVKNGPYVGPDRDRRRL